MKRVQDDEDHEHVEMSPTEARQAHQFRPVFYILVISTLGAFLLLWLIYAVFF